jgi:hypothetical protein
MGQVLDLRRGDADVSGGFLSTDATREFFALAPPLVPIDGVDPLPGESWRAYNQRIGALLHAKSPATVPGQPPHPRRGTVCLVAFDVVIATLIYVMVLIALGMAVFE